MAISFFIQIITYQFEMSFFLFSYSVPDSFFFSIYVSRQLIDSAFLSTHYC